ncbi:Domain of unknown function DUF4224 [uncultured Caudovirales phage]|uniref:DUF4224 domain-containing protein n=1 Tax=uncultured Caudovirales phage TaxID=2100421 RepID=A0A6J5NVI9_9CAUD|nr:Domain of unknown function DUF4224 [uncultured Caudovirales phage]
MAKRPDVTLSEEEIRRLTGGYKQPARQLAALHDLGYARARRSELTGRVVLERAHYEAVASGSAAAKSSTRTPQLR